MSERRRHQRVRFAEGVRLRIGYDGQLADASLENLSLGGLMLCCPRELPIRQLYGVEIIVSDRMCIELVVQLVNRVGDRYGARFSPGPLSEAQIRLAVSDGLSAGRASMHSVKVEDGRRIMRVNGLLGSGMRADILLALNSGVAEVDLSGVTAVDAEGQELCALIAADRRAMIVRPATCVERLLKRLAR